MTCRLCSGAKVVYSPVGAYGVTVGPCPNCTDVIHEHYEHELERKLAYDGEDRLVGCYERAASH